MSEKEKERAKDLSNVAQFAENIGVMKIARLIFMIFSC
jgi:hypothetical protein